MKRLTTLSILMLLLLTILSSPVSAQEEHMKFMGIPMGIPIDDFESKLEKKGFTRLRLYSEGTGIVYEGVFAGKGAEVYILYDHKSQKVYSAIVHINCLNESSAFIDYKEYCGIIKDKYFKNYDVEEYDSIYNKSGEGYKWINNKMLDGKHEATIFTIPRSSPLDLRNVLGLISVSTSDFHNPESSVNEFLVHIGYLDYITHQENEENQKEDF